MTGMVIGNCGETKGLLGSFLLMNGFNTVCCRAVSAVSAGDFYADAVIILKDGLTGPEVEKVLGFAGMLRVRTLMFI